MQIYTLISIYFETSKKHPNFVKGLCRLTVFQTMARALHLVRYMIGGLFFYIAH